MTGARDLEVVLRRASEFDFVIPEGDEDGNGHVSSRRYAELHDQATDALFRRIGYPRADRLDGVFNIQSATRHLGEVLVGHRVSGHVVLDDFDGRFFQVSGHIVNRTTGLVATSFEALLGNVSLQSRRLQAAPAEVVAQAERERAAAAELGWAPLGLPPIRIRRAPDPAPPSGSSAPPPISV